MPSLVLFQGEVIFFMRNVRHFRTVFAFGLFAAALSATVPAFAQSSKRMRAQNTIPTRTAPAVNAPATIADAPRTVLPVSSDTEIRRGLRFEAFVDPMVRISSKDQLFGGTANNGITPVRGFVLNDAAIYISKDLGKATAFVDLPFFTDSSTAGNDFAFAQQRAQAYVGLDLSPVLVKFGQYDSPFGVEANDSRDRFFAERGLVRTYVLPFTFMGAQAIYSMEQASKLTFRGQISNPADTGFMGTQNPEFGGQFRLDNNGFYGAFGFSFNDSASAANNKTNMLVNIMGGWGKDKFRVDGEFDLKKTANFDKTGNAFYIIATYLTSEQLALGGRFEFLKDIAVPSKGTSLENAFSFSFGPSYKYSDDLVLRADVSFANFKPANVSEESVFSVGGSAVLSL